ncbi:MAG: glutaminyl-peptide cyclotransferase [Proteobacteria bacterium]|uniref:glutaminyl-peptide cyclotransferase n=1 Tax=Rudaea sp. TaxID=2136325 RepID=UPI0032209EC7|nr:glutaminyl-peptide cyclotransferase [Pseudomonadota bacterium]
MKTIPAIFAAAPALSLALSAAVAAPADIPVYSYEVVNVYPHDRGAFTEGLFFRDGYLYESTGMNGASSIRKVELKSGRVVQQHDLSDAVFGEGIVDWKNELVSVTWKTQEGYVFDLATFAFKRKFNYPGEGWGMTHDDKNLLLSDGSATIRALDPQTLRQTGAIHVTAQGRPLDQLNELEWVKGQIYANIWQTSRIARIDPKTGRVTAWIDLSGLLSHADRAFERVDVLNGIAYDAKQDRLFVTGKYWPNVFEIRLVAPAAQK